MVSLRQKYNPRQKYNMRQKYNPFLFRRTKKVLKLHPDQLKI